MDQNRICINHNFSNRTTDNGMTMSTFVTPKKLSSALRDDVIGRFLDEVKDEIGLVKKRNAWIKSMKMG
jgi:hypothetical protein